jgi:hypothetical protein
MIEDETTFKNAEHVQPFLPFVLLLLLFTIVAIGGGLKLALGGMLGIGIWIGGFYWRPLSWIAFLGRVAGL